MNKRKKLMTGKKEKSYDIETLPNDTIKRQGDGDT